MTLESGNNQQELGRAPASGAVETVTFESSEGTSCGNAGGHVGLKVSCRHLGVTI